MTDIHQFIHGQMKCTVINDGNITIRPTSTFFEGAGESELAETLAEYDISPDGMTIPCNIMLVEMDDYRILVDCGSGGELNGYDADLGRLFAGFTDIDISVEDITHVILTHGHFDHFAGCVDDGGNFHFPNATYLMDKDEYAWWLKEYRESDFDKRMHRKLMAIKPRLQLCEANESILSGVRLIATPGHTTYHTSVEFESDGEILLCPIDVMDHHLQGKHPTWGANWDFDREQSIKSRLKILARAVETNALVHGFHFPFPGLGRFRANGDIWQWEDET